MIKTTTNVKVATLMKSGTIFPNNNCKFYLDNQNLHGIWLSFRCFVAYIHYVICCISKFQMNQIPVCQQLENPWYEIQWNIQNEALHYLDNNGTLHTVQICLKHGYNAGAMPINLLCSKFTLWSIICMLHQSLVQDWLSKSFSIVLHNWTYHK